MKSKFLLYLGVFLFSAFFLTGCTSRENISISEGLVQEGLEFYEERYYKEALDKFVEALEKYPANFDAYVSLTQILLDKGYLDEAEDLSNEASLRLGGSDVAVVYSMVGSKYYEDNDSESAVRMYGKAVRADSSYENGLVGLAESYIQKGDIENARRSLGNKGDSDDFLLLYAYLTLDDWDSGFEKIQKMQSGDLKDKMREIYEIDDEDVLYKNTFLAREYINSGYPYLAIELLTSQDKEIDQYADSQYFLGKAYLDYGDYIGAIEKLNSAIALDLDEDEVYLSLARAYLLSENLDRALNTYETIVSASNIDIVNEYVDVLLENEMGDKAEGFLVGLLSEKESFDLDIILAKIYYEKGDFDKLDGLISDLDSETNLTQSQTRNLKKYKLYNSIEKMDDYREIDELIERYSVFDRYNPELYLFRGKLMLEQERDLEAEEALERAIELDLNGDIIEEASKLLASID